MINTDLNSNINTININNDEINKIKIEPSIREKSSPLALTIAITLLIGTIYGVGKLIKAASSNVYLLTGFVHGLGMGATSVINTHMF